MPLKSGDCMGLTPEEATYNVMTVFFDMTLLAAFYGGTVGTESIQYVDVPFFDFAYVQATPCPPVASPSLGYTSIQDLYARANRDLLGDGGTDDHATGADLHEDCARSCDQCGGERGGGSAVDRAEYVGRDQGIEPRDSRRLAHLAAHLTSAAMG